MPVRIYDISKKLGLENKEVLMKAKELGIAAAKVASSSLDKITAEYLEDKLKEAHPELANPTPAPPPPAPTPPQPITIIAAPPPEPPPPVFVEPPVVVAAPKAAITEPSVPEQELVEAKHTNDLPVSTPVGEPLEAKISAPPPASPPAPMPPPRPPMPQGPRVGDKVGFINLPSKPGP